MDEDERQLMFTAAWLFARHGQRHRARIMCEALVEDAPQDGVSAIALAQLLLEEHEAERALDTLRGAHIQPEMQRMSAMLECRALWMLGRKEESIRRWNRYVTSSRGARRNWVEDGSEL